MGALLAQLGLEPRAMQLALVLALSFLLGLEREGRKGKAGHYVFGGVRTFPLIGLLGYAVALLAAGNWVAVMLGLLAVAAFLVVSYVHKVAAVEEAGVTTEITGLFTYAVGALVASEWYWLATALVVVALLLLELKSGLEGIAERIPPREILTLAQFLLLSAVALPLLPNRPFGAFAINPFRVWLVVVAVSGLSYLSYLLQLRLGERASVTVAAVLGGLYSSTMATLVLARRSREVGGKTAYAAAASLACSVMYLRVLLLVWLFAPPLGAALAGTLTGLFLLGGGVASLWLARCTGQAEEMRSPRAPLNPLELSTALLFAAVFLALTVGSQLVAGRWGSTGVYAFSLVAGFVDVDPYVMSLAQQVAQGGGLEVAAKGVLLALASNQLAKGLYGFALASPRAGGFMLFTLAAMALATVLPLLWL